MHKVARSACGTKWHNTLILRTFGKLSFVLFSEAGLDPVEECAFRIEGCGLKIEGVTDEFGEFEREPVPFGDYHLFIGDADFVIPAIPPDESPHPVHIPYEVLPEFAEWSGPTEEEPAENLTEDETEEPLEKTDG
jgi:hypothetical protein